MKYNILIQMFYRGFMCIIYQYLIYFAVKYNSYIVEQYFNYLSITGDISLSSQVYLAQKWLSYVGIL